MKLFERGWSRALRRRARNRRPAQPAGGEWQDSYSLGLLESERDLKRGLVVTEFMAWEASISQWMPSFAVDEATRPDPATH